MSAGDIRFCLVVVDEELTKSKAFDVSKGDKCKMALLKIIEASQACIEHFLYIFNEKIHWKSTMDLFFF